MAGASSAHTQNNTMHTEQDIPGGSRAALVDRDTELARLRDMLQTRDAQLAQKDAQLAQMSAALAQRYAENGRLRSGLESVQTLLGQVLQDLNVEPSLPPTTNALHPPSTHHGNAQSTQPRAQATAPERHFTPAVQATQTTEDTHTTTVAVGTEPAAPSHASTTGTAPTDGEQKLSFGAGFFGAQPADNCYDPTQRLPDLSLLPFVERYADADVCSVLSACCRAGRDLVRRTARKEQLRVQLGCSDDTWQEQLITLKQAMEVRCVQPAQITVVCDYGTTELCVARVTELVGLLQGTGHTIRTLDVNADQYNDVSGLLSQLAPVLPNLARLVVQGKRSEELIVLPPPTTWPYLRAVKLEIGDPYFFNNSNMPLPLIAPYMAQITRLELHYSTRDDSEWHNIFPLGRPTHTLSHLASPWKTLRGSLISLLLTHAPSVKHLTVWDIAEGIAPSIREHEWGLEELVLTQESDLYLDLGGMLCLASLPRPRTGRVDLGYRVGQDAKPRQLLFTITSTEGIEGGAECLAHWRFLYESVVIQCAHIPPSDQGAALSNTFAQLKHMEAPFATVSFEGWDTSAVAETLAEGLPALSHLRFAT